MSASRSGRFITGIEFQFLFNKRVDGPWSLSVHNGEEKKLVAPNGI